MIFNVKLYFEGSMVYEVEAIDDEMAEELAVDLLHSDNPRLDLDIVDALVTKSNNQYTAEQECEDDDRRGIDEDGI